MWVKQQTTTSSMWVEYDVEAGGASAGSLKMMHKTKTRRRRKKRDRVLMPFPSLSSDMELYFYKLHARVQAIPFKSYYSQYKAYVPDQDRMLRLLQYIIYFVAVMLPSSSPRVNAFPSSSSSLPSPLWHMHDRVSFGRYLFRFYYLADAVPATKSGSWGVNKTLGQVMAACMVGYYPFEHFAFWLWYQPQLFPTNVVDWADFLWSIASMFWFVYLLAELCNYTILLQGHLKERATKRNNNDYHLIRKDIDYRIQDTTLQIMRACFYLLPSLHWAFPHWDTDPLLSNNCCYGLMFMESMFAVSQYANRRRHLRTTLSK